jgi:hypothetical protein
MQKFSLQTELNGLDISADKSFLYEKLNTALLSCEFSAKNVEVVISENVFKAFGQPVIKALKTANCLPNITLTALDTDLSLHEFSKDIIVVGNAEYLLGVLPKLPITANAIAIPCSPVFSRLNGVGDRGYNLIIVDEEFILKAPADEFAESFLTTMSKPLAVIDAKINAYLKGERLKEDYIPLVKKAVSITSKLPLYDNYKKAIIGAEFIMLAVNVKTGDFIGGGTDALARSVKTCIKGLTPSQVRYVAFEKTAKLYHFYFTNDLSSLLAVAPYREDLEELSGLISADTASKLSVPSPKRIKLINALVEQLKPTFSKETGGVILALNSVNKIYTAICKKSAENISIYYKKIKTAVKLASYSAEKTSVLTLCRDAGVIACAN